MLMYLRDSGEREREREIIYIYIYLRYAFQGSLKVNMHPCQCCIIFVMEDSLVAERLRWIAFSFSFQKRKC